MSKKDLVFMKERLARSKSDCSHAKKAGLKEFNLDAVKLLIDYARYLLEHLKNYFKKAKQINNT